MACFPFFVELDGRPGLIVGGGGVAARKLEKLLPYGPRLTVIAPRIREDIRAAAGVTLVERAFREEDLEGDWLFVIAATDCRAVNREIALSCRMRRVPVDVADAGGEGTFLFPALVKRGGLSIGVSTGGASPGASAYVRERIDRAIPEGFEEILAYLEALRGQLRGQEPDRERRAGLLEAVFRACLAAGRPLAEGELKKLREKGGWT